MKKLKAKLRKQGGFTLVEMLIVVGIIAILVAVSIPMVNNSLERARHATDAANERAAKAAAVLELVEGTIKYPSSGTEVHYYDAKTGEVQAANTSVSDSIPVATYGKHKNHKAIIVELSTDKYEIKWTTGTNAVSANVTDDLCSNREKPDHT